MSVGCTAQRAYEEYADKIEKAEAALAAERKRRSASDGLRCTSESTCSRYMPCYEWTARQ